MRDSEWSREAECADANVSTSRLTTRQYCRYQCPWARPISCTRFSTASTPKTDRAMLSALISSICERTIADELHVAVVDDHVNRGIDHRVVDKGLVCGRSRLRSRPAGGRRRLLLHLLAQSYCSEYGIAAHGLEVQGDQGGRDHRRAPRAARTCSGCASCWTGSGRPGAGGVPGVAAVRPRLPRGVRLHAEGRRDRAAVRLHPGRLRVRGAHRGRPPLHRRPGQRPAGRAGVAAGERRHGRGVHLEVRAGRPVPGLAVVRRPARGRRRRSGSGSPRSGARTRSSPARTRSAGRCARPACRCSGCSAATR